MLAIVLASSSLTNFQWWRFLVALSWTGRSGRFIRAYLWLLSGLGGGLAWFAVLSPVEKRFIQECAAKDVFRGLFGAGLQLRVPTKLRTVPRLTFE